MAKLLIKEMMGETMMEYNQKERICIYAGQFALLVVLSAGWWGLLYPNLAMTEETYQAVSEDGQSVDKASGTEDFFAILSARPGELAIKSRAADAILKWSGLRREEETKKELQNGDYDENEQKRPDRGV